MWKLDMEIKLKFGKGIGRMVVMYRHISFKQKQANVNSHWPFIMYDVQGYNVMHYTLYWLQTIKRKLSYFLCVEGSTEIIAKQ